MDRRTRHAEARRPSFFERDIAEYGAGRPDDRDAFLHVIRQASLKTLMDHVDLFLEQMDLAVERRDRVRHAWAWWRFSRMCDEIDVRRLCESEAVS
jgi:Mg2+/Co2+ transporter CorC